MLVLRYVRSYSREHKAGLRRRWGGMTSGILRSSLEADLGQLAARDAVVDTRLAVDRAAEAAVNGLLLDRPDYCAGSPMPAWQSAVAIAGALLLPTSLLLVFTDRGGLISALLAMLFALIVAIRIAALWQIVWPCAAPLCVRCHLDDTDLPSYTVLVPLHREAAVAPALVQALNAIDYPCERLEILFVTEELDEETRASLTASLLADHMRILTVPAGLPQTKPRALNYGLKFAAGALVAVYDAEDVPEPRQLRRAAEKFAASGPDLACVQARLST